MLIFVSFLSITTVRVVVLGLPYGGVPKHDVIQLVQPVYVSEQLIF